MVIAGAVIAAILHNNKQDSGVLPTPPEQADPAGDDRPDNTDPVDGEGNTGSDETPVTEAYDRIELQGDQQQYDAVYRVGNTGYEMYTYVPDVARRYAEAVTATANELSGTAAVYALAVPLSSGITLPDELTDMAIFGNQQRAEEDLDAMMGESVRFVPLYDALMRHRTEYVYYRTDHHWTGLGAYYAYRQFCQAKGIAPHELTDYAVKDFPGFLGSFYNDTNSYPGMKDNPDTVTAYYPIAEAPMTVTDQKGNTTTFPSAICDESTAPAAYKYGAYIYGDNTFTVLRNQSLQDGSCCLVVKESFGNAFVPFLADHYQTVYVADYRYWSGSIKAFVRENGVQDVLFINNLSAVRNGYLIGKLQGIA
ncbi:MAG: hypothetical protein J5482_04710 [Oscillospiraceae bacterium]|nr:hypothetical protein [Oscillospiraceae bacterium]